MKFIERYFAYDKPGYSLFSSIAATALLWGMAKGFSWLYDITPWWIKLPIACLFCAALYKQLRKDMVEDAKKNQEQPHQGETE